MTHPNEGPRSSARRMPFLIESCAGSIEGYLAIHRNHVMHRLTEHGAVMFRGFGPASVESFGAFIQALGIEPLDYVYRSTPRTRQGKGFYTATEYPAEREIPMHNENSYQRTWPRKLAFCCVKPAAVGGATPLADMLEVQRRLDPAIIEKFQQLGVRYDRVFHEYIDLPWQEVFQTEQHAEVEKFCALNEIQFEWLEDDVLRTSQINPGVVLHPLRQENFLFNQAHLFHPSALGEETLAALLDAFGPDLLPRSAYYGNGEAIEPETLDQIRTAFDAAAIDIHWQAGDIVLLDNIQVAHGRRTYQGERILLASLLESNQL
jgi:alpha-ketoglutarate-dependent taurine dioxygenase